MPLAVAMASGAHEDLTLTLRRSLDPTAPQLPAGADALQKIKTCLVLVEAALKLATLPPGSRCTRRYQEPFPYQDPRVFF